MPMPHVYGVPVPSLLAVTGFSPDLPTVHSMPRHASLSLPCRASDPPCCRPLRPSLSYSRLRLSSPTVLLVSCAPIIYSGHQHVHLGVQNTSQADFGCTSSVWVSFSLVPARRSMPNNARIPSQLGVCRCSSARKSGLLVSYGAAIGIGFRRVTSRLTKILKLRDKISLLFLGSLNYLLSSY